LVIRCQLSYIPVVQKPAPEADRAGALAGLVGLPDCLSSIVKPRLLVIELWGLGDLVIATPFLQAASRHYAVTLLAKPYAKDLQERFWREVKVIPCIVPWTAFKHKYRLYNWPWADIFRVRRLLITQHFDVGISARWDPRDHILLDLSRSKNRLGFPRMGSQFFLTRSLSRPDPAAHRYENWRVLARELGFELPTRENLVMPHTQTVRNILVHTGAG